MTMDLVGSWIAENYHRWGATRPDRVARIDACEAETGCTRHYVTKRICLFERTGRIPAAPGAYAPAAAPTPAPEGNMNLPQTPGAIDEEALRGEIDVHFKARRFLEGIPAGQFYRLDDAAFAAGVSKVIAGTVFGDARYAEYRGQAVANRVIYFGHPLKIAAMKQEGILR